MRIPKALLVCAGLMGVTMQAFAIDSKPPLTTVSHVDPHRYSGKWYEIARYRNWFQRNCQLDTTATYSVRADGKIEIVNTCREANGKIDSVRGTAKVSDQKTNAKLRVTFFWPFSGNYWIVALGDDYEYAVIGEPNRKYLWILSRTPQMDERKYRRVLQQVRDLGYDPGKLLKTAHTPIAEPAGSGNN
jgi:apolipoprotein D and lipocalin family protein